MTDSTSIHIRQATLDDLDTLLEFEQGLIKAELPMDETIIRNEVTHYYDIPFLIQSSETRLMVAEADGKVIGCGYGKIMENERWSIEKIYGYVGFMFVREAFRGKGVSDMIIQNLCDWFRENGLKEVRLKVYENNPSAIKAYKKTGFAEHQKIMRMNIN